LLSSTTWSQLVVEEGFLYPFNFKATATSQTIRVIEKGGSRIAALYTESSIRVDDPVAVFGTFTEKPGWPYRQITCLTTEAGPGKLDPATGTAMVHIVDGVNRRYLTSHPVTSNVQCITVHQPSGATFAGNRVTGEIARLAPVDIATTTWR
jgi:hypothetical protein